MEAGRGLTLAGKLFRTMLLQLPGQAGPFLAPVAGEGCQAANREGFLVQVGEVGRWRPGRSQGHHRAPRAREPLPPEAGQLQLPDGVSQVITRGHQPGRFAGHHGGARPPGLCSPPALSEPAG